MTTKHDITIPQASTFRIVVTVADGPADLTDYTADMQIRQTKLSDTTLADITNESFTVEALTRQVILELTDEQTGLYDWARPAVYDMYIEGPAGDRWRLLEGLATLNKTVTREV
jgi:hypothetical protein